MLMISILSRKKFKKILGFFSFFGFLILLVTYVNTKRSSYASDDILFCKSSSKLFLNNHELFEIPSIDGSKVFLNHTNQKMQGYIIDCKEQPSEIRFVHVHKDLKKIMDAKCLEAFCKITYAEVHNPINGEKKLLFHVRGIGGGNTHFKNNTNIFNFFVENDDLLTILPINIKYKVFSYLHDEDIIHIAHVSKDLRSIAREAAIEKVFRPKSSIYPRTCVIKIKKLDSTELDPAINEYSFFRGVSLQLLRITSGQMKNLAMNQNLVYLKISNNFLKSKSLESFSRALRNNNSLHTLILNFNHFKDKAVCALFESLKNNNTLTLLSLNNGMPLVEKNVGNSLYNFLAYNTSLTELSLKSNDLGDAGIKALSLALQTNQVLKVLRLDCNSIHDKGVKELESALHKNTTLIELYLSNNRIGDEGLRILSEALQEPNCYLKILDLSSNWITDTELVFLSKALTKNKHLTELDLTKNKITDERAGFLSESLFTNTTLRILKFKPASSS